MISLEKGKYKQTGNSLILDLTEVTPQEKGSVKEYVIMIVDDEMMNILALRSLSGVLLERCTFITADNGRDAVDKF